MKKKHQNNGLYSLA